MMNLCCARLGILGEDFIPTGQGQICSSIFRPSPSHGYAFPPSSLLNSEDLDGNERGCTSFSIQGPNNNLKWTCLWYACFKYYQLMFCFSFPSNPCQIISVSSTREDKKTDPGFLKATQLTTGNAKLWILMSCHSKPVFFHAGSPEISMTNNFT